MPFSFARLSQDVSTQRQIALEVALSYHGTWYSWGGDDPEGFDCSGLMIEALKSAGELPRKFDNSAQGLYNMYRSKVSAPRPGCLVFFGTNIANITHVEMIVAVIGDLVLSIGASGGNRATKTKEDAMRDNAFIKIRPVRADLVATVDPWQA